MKIEDRFWSKVDKSGNCWEWTAYKNSDGYGKFCLGGVAESAHRVVLMLEGVDIPSGMCVCHTCDNPGCVNPSHLFVGTQADNVMDSALKMRHRCSKLTPEDKAQIRKMRKDNTLYQLADRFGVSYQRIWQVCHR